MQLLSFQGVLKTGECGAGLTVKNVLLTKWRVMLILALLLCIVAWWRWQYVPEHQRTLVKYVVEDTVPWGNHGDTINGILLGSSTLARIKVEQLPFCQGWLNRAIGNSTIDELLTYLQWSPSDYYPDSVFIYAGDNDIARGRTVDDVMGHYRQLISRVNETYHSPEIHLLAVKRAPARRAMWNQVDQLNSQLSVFAGETERLNFHWHFAQLATPHQPHLFTDDGIHLTQSGYQKLFQGVPIKCD